MTAEKYKCFAGFLIDENLASSGKVYLAAIKSEARKLGRLGERFEEQCDSRSISSALERASKEEEQVRPIHLGIFRSLALVAKTSLDRAVLLTLMLAYLFLVRVDEALHILAEGAFDLQPERVIVSLSKQKGMKRAKTCKIELERLASPITLTCPHLGDIAFCPHAVCTAVKNRRVQWNSAQQMDRCMSLGLPLM